MSTTRIQRSGSRQGPLAPAARKRLDAPIRRLRLRLARLVSLDAVPLRVGFVGEEGFARMAGAVDSFAVQPDWVGSLAARAGSKLDLLMVDAAPFGFELETVTALIAEARALGARVVGLRKGEYLTVWAGAVDLELELGPQPGPQTGAGARRLPFGPQPRPRRGAIPRLSLVAHVNPREVNPIGFKWATDRGLAAVGTLDRARPGGDGARRRLAEAAHWAKVDLFPTGEPPTQSLPAGVEVASEEQLDAQERRERLRDYRAVVDHAALYPNAYEHAGQIVELSAAGVPVLLRQMAAATRALLGNQLAAALELTSFEALEHPGERERASVAARRAALREHSIEAAWRRVAEEAGATVPRPRALSVIVATNRPTHLEHVIAQVNHQSYQPRELVIVLHGDQFPSNVEGRLKQLVEGAVTVVRVSSTATLGDALNAGTDAASGELITKMDDDDWYGPEHLWDLVLAAEYSGAELVAKGAEFVYLEQLDLTIRRFVGRAESSNRTIAGGTLTISRPNLQALGGWRPLAHGVDVWLLADVERAGGRVFRTHGFGYIYRRHAAQTWAKGVDYFLRQSEGQWRGLDLDVAEARWPVRSGGERSGSGATLEPWHGGIATRARPTAAISTSSGFGSSPATPRTLAGLRMAVLAAPAHLDSLVPVCETVDASAPGWRSPLESAPPHLVLIESSWLQEEPAEPGDEDADPPRAAPERVEQALELLEWCRDRDVPTALWETSPTPLIATPSSLMEGVRHLFCADPEAVPHLAARLEGRRPLVLPLAAQVIPKRVARFGERAPDVAFLWPWDTSGEHMHAERMNEIFDVAARYGVVILKTTPGPASGLPRRMRPFVDQVSGYQDALAAFQRHRIVVPFDPRLVGSLMVSQVIFDAAAAGNVTLVPHQKGVVRLWRFLATSSRSWRDAQRQIPRLLMDSHEWTEISTNSRRAVLNAHTYAHRIASVASVAALSVTPTPTTETTTTETTPASGA